MRRRDFLALLSATTTNIAAATVSAKSPGNTSRSGIKSFLSEGDTPPDGVVRFIAFGDAGTGDHAQFDLSRVMATRHWNRLYDTALLLGDNIYPSGSASTQLT